MQNLPTVSRQIILTGGCALKKLAGNISQIEWFSGFPGFVSLVSFVFQMHMLLVRRYPIPIQVRPPSNLPVLRLSQL